MLCLLADYLVCIVGNRGVGIPLRLEFRGCLDSIFGRLVRIFLGSLEGRFRSKFVVFLVGCRVIFGRLID